MGPDEEDGTRRGGGTPRTGPCAEIKGGHEAAIWSLAWHPTGHILCSGRTTTPASSGAATARERRPGTPACAAGRRRSPSRRSWRRPDAGERRAGAGRRVGGTGGDGGRETTGRGRPRGSRGFGPGQNRPPPPAPPPGAPRVRRRQRRRRATRRRPRRRPRRRRARRRACAPARAAAGPAAAAGRAAGRAAGAPPGLAPGVGAKGRRTAGVVRHRFAFLGRAPESRDPKRIGRRHRTKTAFVVTVGKAVWFFFFRDPPRRRRSGCLCRRGNTGVDAGSGEKSAARFDAFATFTEATVGYRLRVSLRLATHSRTGRRS